MKKKLINIFTNGSQFSLETQADLTKKLVDRGYTVTREYSQDAELIICIGGDLCWKPSIPATFQNAPSSVSIPDIWDFSRNFHLTIWITSSPTMKTDNTRSSISARLPQK